MRRAFIAMRYLSRRGIYRDAARHVATKTPGNPHPAEAMAGYTRTRRRRAGESSRCEDPAPTVGIARIHRAESCRPSRSLRWGTPTATSIGKGGIPKRGVINARCYECATRSASIAMRYFSRRGTPRRYEGRCALHRPYHPTRIGVKIA